MFGSSPGAVWICGASSRKLQNRVSANCEMWVLTPSAPGAAGQVLWGRAGPAGAHVNRWVVRRLSLRGACAPAECQNQAHFLAGVRPSTKGKAIEE